MKSKAGTLSSLLGKEFWGILMMETNLSALYDYLGLQQKGIGPKRFMDWVLFPDKMPVDFQTAIEAKLESRYDHPKYHQLVDREMNQTETSDHNLVFELLHLKYGGLNDPRAYKRIYQLPTNIFFSTFLQMVEQGFVGARDAVILFQYYNSQRGPYEETQRP